MFALRTPRIAGLVVTRSSRFKQNYAMDHGPWDVRRPPASPCRAAVLVGQRRAGCFAEFKKLLHLAADLCHSDEWQLMARCALQFTASLAASCPLCDCPFGLPLPSRRHLEVPRLTYSNRKSDVPIADEEPWPLCWATYDQLGKRHACTKDQPGVRDSGLEKVVSSLFNN